MSSIVFDCFYELSLQVFSIYEPFQEAPVLVCEIYMTEFTANASVVELFFCRDLTCSVNFKRNVYVRMTIYSSLEFFSA